MADPAEGGAPAADLNEEQYRSLVQIGKAKYGLSDADATRKLIAAGHTFNGKQLDPQTLKPVESGVGWDTQLPGLKQAAGAVGSAADRAQGLGERVAEEVGGKRGTTAGAIAGSRFAAASTVLEFGKGLIPTTPKDIAILLATEGAGRLGSMAAKTSLGKPIASVLNKEVGPLANKAISMIPGAETALSAIKATTSGGIASVKQAANAVAERAISAAQDLKIPLTPAQLTQSKSWSMFERILDRFPVASDILNDFHLKQEQALSDARQGILSTFSKPAEDLTLGRQTEGELSQRIKNLEAGRSKLYGNARAEAAAGLDAPALPEQKGAAILSSQQGRQAMMRAHRDDLYDRARALLPDPNAKIQPAKLTEEANNIMGEYGANTPRKLRGPAFGIAHGYVKPPESEAAKVLEGIDPSILKRAQENPKLMAQLPQPVQQALKEQGGYTFEQLDTQIKRLGDEAKKARLPSGEYTSEGRQLLRMQKAAQQDLDAHYATQGPEVQKAYQLAKAFHGEYAETHRSKIIQDLYQKDPRSVFEAVVKGGNEVNTQRLTQALGRDGKQIVKRQLFDIVFGDGNTIPNKTDALERLNQYGPSLRAVLTVPEQNALKAFASKGEAPAFLQGEYERAVRSLLKNSPQHIPDLVLGGDELTAKAIKKYTSPQLFEGYGSKLASKILQANPTQPEFGNAGILKRMGRYDDGYLKTFYPQKTIDGMRKIGEASQLLPGFGDLAQRPVNGKDGMILFGAMGAMLSPVRAVKTLGAIVIQAPLLAKLYTSEFGQRALTTLMRMPETDPRGPQLLARLAQMGYLHHGALMPQQQPKAKGAPGGMGTP